MINAPIYAYPRLCQSKKGFQQSRKSIRRRQVELRCHCHRWRWRTDISKKHAWGQINSKLVLGHFEVLVLAFHVIYPIIGVLLPKILINSIGK